MKERILFVDDEPSILQAYKRSFRKLFDMEIATSGREGLEALKKMKGVAVIISDMNMPGMDGITFLKKAREVAPDAVRIMLTGVADLHTAVDAVNESEIFRFLSKPCSPEKLAKSVNDGLKQYRLVTAEKELLENTLKGSVKMLVEMLSITNPLAFSRSERIKQYMGDIVAELSLPDSWRYELAAMLSQIGCVTVPTEILEKYVAGAALDLEEQKMLDAHPQTAAGLLKNIPRLETVAYIIAGDMAVGESSAGVRIGIHILHAVERFDQLTATGVTPSRAVELIREEQPGCEPKVVQALSTLSVIGQGRQGVEIGIEELKLDMVLARDVVTANGLLVVAQGQRVTSIIRRRLQNFAMRKSIDSSVEVYG